MNRPVAALGSIAVACPALADVAAPARAIETAQAYAEAVMGANCSEVVRMSGVLARHPEATEGLCATYLQWSRSSIQIVGTRR